MKKETENIFYLLMFQTEGHKTWRLNNFRTKEGLHEFLERTPKHPNIIATRWFVADRITGNIIEEK